MSHKNEWAIYIGYLIISMNEIDSMTLTCQKEIIKKKITKNWIKKPLADRLKYIIEKLSDYDESHKVLVKLFNQALDLCPARNLVAHGSFALDCRSTIDNRKAGQFILYSHKTGEPAAKTEIQKATRQCIQLSNDIAEYIAITRLNDHAKKKC